MRALVVANNIKAEAKEDESPGAAAQPRHSPVSSQTDISNGERAGTEPKQRSERRRRLLRSNFMAATKRRELHRHRLELVGEVAHLHCRAADRVRIPAALHQGPQVLVAEEPCLLLRRPLWPGAVGGVAEDVDICGALLSVPCFTRRSSEGRGAHHKASPTH